MLSIRKILKEIVSLKPASIIKRDEEYFSKIKLLFGIIADYLEDSNFTHSQVMGKMFRENPTFGKLVDIMVLFGDREDKRLGGKLHRYKKTNIYNMMELDSYGNILMFKSFLKDYVHIMEKE